MSKSKLRYEERRLAIKEYQEGKGSYKTIPQKYGNGITTLQDMIATYEPQGLREKGNKKYGTDYLSGKGSQQEICKKYKIRNRRQLRAWIKWYNGHQKFKKHSSAKVEIYMTK